MYRSLLHISWIDKLVDNVKTLFLSLYGDQLRKPHTSLVRCADFDGYFDQQVRELEDSAPASRAPIPLLAQSDPELESSLDDEPPPIPGILARNEPKNGQVPSNELTPVQTSDSSRPLTPSSEVVTAKAGRGGKMSRRARKITNSPSTHASSGDEKARRGKGAKTAAVKKGRKWDADGLADDDSDMPLDYSVDSPDARGEGLPGAVEAVDQASWGSRTGEGQFVLKDLDDEVHSILSSAGPKKADESAAPPGMVGSGLSAIGGLFRNIVGGKTLTKADLDKAMKGMEDHLLKKNVAREAALRLCEGVERELVGVKTGNFESEYFSRNAKELY